MNLTYAHLADLHLGGWREKTLTNLNFYTFEKAIAKVIEHNVDFCIFAGDIFNSAVPPMDLVHKVVNTLMKLKEAGIPLYVIGGSHDYSATGKSFLDLLESANVFTNVAKWHYVDKDQVELEWTWHEDKVLLSGIIGKKNGLEKVYYKNISKQDLPEDVYKIFVFHTTLNDLKPDFMAGYKTEVTSNYLPKGFNYYAGGHVHTYIDSNYAGGRLSYPGPLFPNSVSELKRETPSFNICHFDGEKTTISREFLDTYDFDCVYVESNMHKPLELKEKVLEEIEQNSFDNKIVLLEIKGIVDGKVSEIGLIDLTKTLYEKGAQQVIKHVYNLSSSQVNENVDIDTQQFSPQEIEEEVIKEILSQSNNAQEKEDKIKSLLNLDLEKQEEEKNAHYESRVKEAIRKCL